ncbi:MAG: PTS glucose transporter subunit IIA [Ancrocorticia sp.]|jgi:PTS system N-acetylglucosamine-specific IIA component|nr:PTS glucose transporter subunit IIA [Ancrocorticia sp.]MCI2001718.1 PTS glucose transporter subunit IIA [Ancrocorticia sp.]
MTDSRQIVAPLSGSLVAMSAVPDPVFAAAMVGPGAAIEPFPGGLTVVAPCAGTILKVQPHGIVIQRDEQVMIVVHLGLDTVKLKGRGFTELLRAGQHVDQSQPIALWNTSVATRAGYSLCTPIVVIGAQPGSVHNIPQSATVEVGKPFLRYTPASR